MNGELVEVMWHIQVIVLLLSMLIVRPTFANINSDLLTAAAKGHSDSAQLLLKIGADVNAEDSYGESVLIIAAKYGHTDTVKRLLEAGAKIDAVNKLGQTSLILSAKNGHSDTVKVLLEAGANINAQDLNGKTALLVSAKNGQTEIVETLLVRNADTSAQDKNGRTALMLAAAHGYTPIVEVLINKGVKVNARDRLFNATALMEAAKKGHIAIVKLLLDNGADVNAKDFHGQTALIQAAKHGFSDNSSTAGFFGHGGLSNGVDSTNHIDTLRTLVLRGADLNAQDMDGWTALMRAAEKGYIITVKILLGEGADVNVKNKFGKTALMYAKQKGYSEIVKLIWDDTMEKVNIGNTTAGKNNIIDEKDQYGQEKLFNAARYGRIEEMQALLDEGIDINVKDSYGATALIFATHFGKKKSVQFLIDRGADVNAKDKYGGTALISARNNGHDEIARLLEEAGKENNNISDQTAKDIQGKQAVMNTKDDTGMNTGISGGQKNSQEQEVKITSSGGPGRQNDGLNRKVSKDINPDLLTSFNKGKIHLQQTFSPKTVNLAIEKRLADPPLIAAARNGDTVAIKDLLAKGADVTVREEKLKETALLAAAKAGHTDIVQLLLENGADVNEKDIFGWTALMTAAENGHINTVQVLLDKGAERKMENELGSTAFELAAKKKHKKIVQLFKEAEKPEGKTKEQPLLKPANNILDKDADRKMENEPGSTTFELATKKKHKKIVRLFKEAEKPEGKTKEQPLLKPAYNILDKDADRKMENEPGSTAFELATKKKHKKIVRLFKEAEKPEGKIKEQPLLKPETKEQPLLRPASNNVAVKQRKKTFKTTGARWAVIIGISNYKDPHIPHLNYASDDAQAFYDWAISPDGGNYLSSQVKLLVDEDATENNIKEALFIWLNQASEKDLITIYFAGHGVPESPEYQDNFFLLAYDTQQNRVASTGFPLWSIEVALERFIKANKVLFIVDADNPENVGQNVVKTQKSHNEIKNPINRGLINLSKVSDKICIITASDSKQSPKRSTRWGGGHGVFTYFLLNGLKGEANANDDNILTLGEVTDFVIENVRRVTRNTQHPDMVGMFDRELPMAYFR